MALQAYAIATSQPAVVVQANFQSFEAPGVAGIAFNLSTGGRYTLNETLGLLEKFAGRAAELQ